jgi:MFS family permease
MAPPLREDGDRLHAKSQLAGRQAERDRATAHYRRPRPGDVANEPVSGPQGRDSWLSLLAKRQVADVAGASMLARLPIAMGAVALVIFVHARTGSFGAAGAVAGAYTLAFALAGPVLGRVVDRRGTRTVLLPAGVACSIATVGVVVLGASDASTGPLVLTAGLAGATTPPVSGIIRRTWPILVESHELPAAYLLDTILTETVFVAGSLLTGVLAALVGPAAPLIAAAGFGLAGTVRLMTVNAVGGAAPAAAEHVTRAGAFASRTLRLLVLTGVPLGAMFGALDVALPAFGAAHGQPALGGLFTACLGVGSVIGGFLYGALRAALGDTRQSYLRLSIAQPLCCLPLLIASSSPTVIVFAILAGLPVTPILTVRARVAQISMPPGTGTETFTLLLLAVMVGISAGATLSGPLVAAGRWQLGVLAAAAAPIATIPLLVVGRGLLPSS